MQNISQVFTWFSYFILTEVRSGWVTCFMKAYPKAIYVHVDNTRDIAVSFTSPFFFTHTNKLHNFQICELNFWSLPFPLPLAFIIDLNCHI
jgi:hypothetical protein